jgi:hypothetical protein
MQKTCPVFTYNRARFDALFDAIYEKSKNASTLKISGVHFYDPFYGEDVHITVRMSKSVHACPRYAEEDQVTTMLPNTRGGIETVFWRALESVLYEMELTHVMLSAEI